MSNCLFVRPLPFVASSSATAPQAGSIANLGNDQPGLVWRGTTTGSLIVDLGASGAAYDTVALFGCNLRATDTVRVQTGNTNTGTGSYDSGVRASFTGTKDDASTSKAIFRLPSTRTDRYIRIDASAPSHPDGYVQFSRLVIGAAILNDGIQVDAEHGFETQSVIGTGPGYRTVDDYPSLDSWKIETGWIDATDWRAKWAPMLRYASCGYGLMFIANVDDASTWQTDAIFGSLGVTPVGKWQAYSKLNFQTKIIAYGP